MKVTPKEKQHIIDLFNRMNNTEDAVLLLNYIKTILFKKGIKSLLEKNRPLKLQTITYLANGKFHKGRYDTFIIPKKNGGNRRLHAPKGVLKTIQRCLNVVFQIVSETYIHESATGFIQNKSVKDNAIIHIGKAFIYNVDLKDFFLNVGFGRVKACLEIYPFNLNGPRQTIAFLFANLCCERNIENSAKTFLPQGAPTSPVLTNIICKKMDRRLAGLAKRFGLNYTRYADDLTFSSNVNVFESDGEFNSELSRIIKDQGFEINSKKTRLQKSGFRQEVTGIVVNKKPNIKKEYLQEVRFYLNMWKKYGEINAQEYYKKKNSIKKNKKLKDVLKGKLLYMRMIKGADDNLYNKYQYIYNSLCSNNNELHKNNVSFLGTGKDKIEKLDVNDMAVIAKKLGLNREDVLERLMNFLAEDKTLPNGKNIISENELDDFLHNPLEANRLLALYSSDETLKFLTHNYDYSVVGFEYVSYVERVRNIFNKKIRPYKKWLNSNTYFKLYYFIEGDYFTTYGHRISMSWTNGFLKEWCLANSNIYPSDFLLPKISQFPIANNRKIKYTYFSDVIKRFKFDIQLRTEDRWQTLDKIITNLFIEQGLSTDFKLTLTGDDYKSVELFVDTVQLKIAISRFFKWIIDHKDRSTNVDVILSDKGGFYELEIFHTGSYATWDFFSEKRNGLSGDINEVRKSLRGVCDWQMIVSNKQADKMYLFSYMTLNQGIDVRVIPVEIESNHSQRSVSQKLILYK